MGKDALNQRVQIAHLCEVGADLTSHFSLKCVGDVVDEHRIDLAAPGLAEPVEPRGVRVVPMGVGRYGEGFERRIDPRGRTYYWMSYTPPYSLEGPETDVTSLAEGYITVTPLHFDLTRTDQVETMSNWDWGVQG